MERTPLPFYESPVIPINSVPTVISTANSWVGYNFVLGYKMDEDNSEYVVVIFYHEDDNATYYEQFKRTICFDLPKWVRV